MYNAQTVKNRIDVRRQEKGVKNVETMLKELGIGKSTVWAMTDNKGIGCFALAKIADYLDCSVDYLLGRTDNPNSSYVNGNNSVLKVVNGRDINDNSSVTITDTQKQDNLTDEFIKLFDKLEFMDKVKIINIVTDMTKK